MIPCLYLDIAIIPDFFQTAKVNDILSEVV